MTTRTVNTTLDLPEISGVNTHFTFSPSNYHSGASGTGSTPNQAVIDLLKDSGIKHFRERLASTNTVQNLAIDALNTTLKIFGTPGDLSSTESEVRAVIANIAGSSRAGRFVAFTGPNEVNDKTDAGTRRWGSDWAVKTVQFMTWVRSEVDAHSWPGSKPLVVGPALKHNGVPYDADIAEIAAARSGGLSLNNVCDAGDFHFYSGTNGPGYRVNGKDDNGNRPAGLPSGTVSVEQFEIQRARQMYGDSAKPMCHSEWGYTSWEVLPRDAKAALLAQETLLRDYNYGIIWSFVYEAVNEDPHTGGLEGKYKTREGQFGIYNLTVQDDEVGPKPAYSAIQQILSYTGSETFSSVGHLIDIGGVMCDAGVNAFSKGGGKWDIYITREKETTARFVLDSGHTIQGYAISNGYYDIPLSDTMTVINVVPQGGTGGAPTFVNFSPPDSVLGTAYSYAITATGSGSITFSINSGSLPAGLSMSALGVISGTSTAGGVSSFTVAAHNSFGDTISPLIDITIMTVPQFTAESPPLTGTVGTAFSYQFEATGIPAPVLSLVGTTIPGCSFSNGMLSGIPTTAGSYSFHIVATNPAGTDTTVTFTVVIVSGGGGGGSTPPVFNPILLPTGRVGVVYDTTVTATGSPSPTFILGSGQLPLGLSLSLDGEIFGTPIAKGSSNFTIIATNSAGSVESSTLTIQINALGSGGGGGGGGGGGNAVISPGVIRTVGDAVFDSDSALHGDLGILFSEDAPNGGQLVYTNPNPQESSGSVYINPHTSVHGKFLPFVQLGPVDGGRSLISWGLKSGGGFGIGDISDNVIAEADGVEWTKDEWVRVDWKQIWDGNKITLSARIFIEPEGTTYVEMSESQRAEEPVEILVGVQANRRGWGISMDTLRLGDNAKNWTGPYGDKSKLARKVFGWIGSPGPDGFVVSTCTENVSSVNIAVSSSQLMTFPTYTTAISPSASGFALHTVTGLLPNTEYYYQLNQVVSGLPVPLGEVRKTITTPAIGALDPIKIAVISCQRGNSVEGRVLDDIRSWAPHGVAHQGDFHYKGITSADPERHAQGYRTQIESAAGLMDLCAERGMWLQISDHETSANNGNNLEGSDGGPATQANLTAYMNMTPHREPMGDDRNPRKGRYTSWVIGRVRFISLDTRNLERSIGTDKDLGNGAKTMLGAHQKAWFFDQLKHDEPLKVILSDPEWMGDLGTGPFKAKDSDKWWAYPTERDEIAEFINSQSTNSGQPIRVDFWGGDTHLLGVCSAENQQWGNFPVSCCSPIDQHPLTSFQGLYDEFYNGGGVNDDNIQLAQYMRMTIEDDGVTIKRTASGIDMLHDGAEVVSMVTEWDTTAGQAGYQNIAFSGNQTTTGFTTTAQVTGVSTVKLGVSITEDMSDVVFGGSLTPDADGFVKFNTTGLTPGTKYYAQTFSNDGTPFGDIMTIQTLPTGAFDLKIGIGSCQNNPQGCVKIGGDSGPLAEAAWKDIRDWSPQLFFHLGDFGYYGGTLKTTDSYTKHVDKLTVRMNSFPVMREVLHSAGFFYEASDHETADNGDRNIQAINQAAIQAYKAIMPVSAYADTRSPIRSRHFSFTIGSHIRIIMVDFRNSDRTISTATDNSSKTALGAVQKAWLKTELTQPETLKVIVSDVPWLANQSGPGQADDKWWNYRTEQNEIAQYIIDNNVNVDWWGGDRHLVGYTSKDTMTASTNPGNFSQIVASCFEKNGLKLNPGEVYDQKFGDDPTNSRMNVAYGRITLSDNGIDTITRVFEGMAVNDTTLAPETWVLESKVYATDTWSY